MSGNGKKKKSLTQIMDLTERDYLLSIFKDQQNFSFGPLVKSWASITRLLNDVFIQKTNKKITTYVTAVNVFCCEKSINN